MSSIAFPEHGVHDAAQEFFHYHPQTALPASNVYVR